MKGHFQDIMFKPRTTPDGTLEERLSFENTPEDIARLISLFKSLKAQDVSSPKALKEDIAFLERVASLQMDAKYYVFDIYDGWSDDHGYNCEGVYTYQRQGNSLRNPHDIFESIPTVEDIAHYLKENNVNQVFTGRIPLEGFLGIEHEYVDADGDERKTKPLSSYDEKYFASQKIIVVRLKTLS